MTGQWVLKFEELDRRSLTCRVFDEGVELGDATLVWQSSIVDGHPEAVKFRRVRVAAAAIDDVVRGAR